MSGANESTTGDTTGTAAEGTGGTGGAEFFNGRLVRAVCGAPASATALAVTEILRAENPRVALLVSENLGRAEMLAEETAFFWRNAAGGGVGGGTAGDAAAAAAGANLRLRALPPPAMQDAEGGGFEAMCDLLATLTALRHDENTAAVNTGTTVTGSAPPRSAPLLIAVSPEALRQPCPAPEALKGREIVVRRGAPLPMAAFVETLANDFGYSNEAVCEAPGQFAVRGGLVDVYPLNAAAPARIDFFGDDVDEIRRFDPTTQRSEDALDTLVISAPFAGDAPLQPAAFLQFLPPQTLWIWTEPEKMGVREIPTAPPADARHAVITEFDAPPEWLAAGTGGDTAGTAAAERWSGRELDLFSAGDAEARLGVDRLSAEENARAELLDAIANWRAAGTDVLVVSETEGGMARIKTLLAERAAITAGATGVTAGAGSGDKSPQPKAARTRRTPNREAASSLNQDTPLLRNSPSPPAAPHRAMECGDLSPLSATGATCRATGATIATGTAAGALRHVLGILAAGFFLERAPQLARPLAVVTEREFFGRHRRRPPTVRGRLLPHRSQVEQLLDFNEIADGDLLVHLAHGVCIFRGVNRIAGAAGAPAEEMISLEFADKITTHLPLREAHLLSRYIGLRKAVPKLGKIGSAAWRKTRAAAAAATADFAAELLSLHAERHARPGIAFPPDAGQPWLHEFERAFPWRETPDQSRAIADAKRDMERPSPMDRLVCGDVGYGKTEVALRAAFKCVLGGFQAAVLAPTTVLAQQHFNTFRERFAKYPVSVEMLSRFRPPAQRARITEQLNAGRIDIIVGTHALLAKSVKIPRLGLLVIDEEHRFGVRQKEAVKRLKTDVDVLSMSATPIPRTLHLALMGARDLSVIETPPRERLPIRTLVRAYDPDLVRAAIRHEIGRGGQVFYLHNRVETIGAVAARLRELVPEARFGVGHGQMADGELEGVMTAFVAGAFDVLVCTTIIETGLDIPNCNTLIIEGADRFGLAQLYQLRGRVGRFNRQAYAYLLLHRHAALLDPARKRLAAIRQHNQLGAGLRLAMRDLELRGAGNILGREQSGHIAGVGFDLYCQLLRQSIARLKGEPAAALTRAETHLDFIRYGEPGTLGAETTDEDAGDAAAAGTAPPCATLPATYIADTRLRIEFYRKFALAATPRDVRDTAAALEDRFGKMPPPAAAFAAIAEIRALAEERGFVSVETEGNLLKCRRARPDAAGALFLQTGNHFPRLSAPPAAVLRRLAEIRSLLLRQPALAATTGGGKSITTTGGSGKTRH